MSVRSAPRMPVAGTITSSPIAVMACTPAVCVGMQVSSGEIVRKRMRSTPVNRDLSASSALSSVGALRAGFVPNGMKV